MRQIKFRVWAEGKMQNVYNLDLGKQEGQELVINKFYVGDVEQFTGLTDKNGKEIYEGDIVRGLLNPEYENFIVDFHQGSFTFRRPTSEDQWWMSDLIETEVIGNIHENPELLQ